MAIQRVVLSGSTNGRPINVTASAASCNQTIHTAGSVTGADNVDEVWLWAVPTTTSTAVIQVFLQLGTSATCDLFYATVTRDPAAPAPTLIAPGLSLNNALKFTAWASACSCTGLYALSGHAFQVRA